MVGRFWQKIVNCIRLSNLAFILSVSDENNIIAWVMVGANYFRPVLGGPWMYMFMYRTLSFIHIHVHVHAHHHWHEFIHVTWLDNNTHAGLPDENGRVEIFQIHTARMKKFEKLDQAVDLPELAKRTRNFTGAEIESVVRSAQATSMNRLINVSRKGCTCSSISKSLMPSLPGVTQLKIIVQVHVHVHVWPSKCLVTYNNVAHCTLYVCAHVQWIHVLSVVQSYRSSAYLLWMYFCMKQLLYMYCNNLMFMKKNKL